MAAVTGEQGCELGECLYESAHQINNRIYAKNV